MHIFSRHRVYIFSGLLALANVCLLIPLFVHAQGFVPLATVPSNSKLGQLTGSSDFSGFINGLFKFAIAIGAIAAVFRLAFASWDLPHPLPNQSGHTETEGFGAYQTCVATGSEHPEHAHSGNRFCARG